MGGRINRATVWSTNHELLLLRSMLYREKIERLFENEGKHPALKQRAKLSGPVPLLEYSRGVGMRMGMKISCCCFKFSGNE